jgi:hypothetical protein
MPDLYDTNFFAWTQQQAEAVRAGLWDAIDREHLAEEIEDWWKRESRLLWHHLEELMVWLVAYSYAPQQRLAHPHWYVRIVSIRCDIEVIVDIWSNLAAKVERVLPEAYAHGRKVASEETGLEPETFPKVCPWTPEQVLSAPLEGPNSPFVEDPC